MTAPVFWITGLPGAGKTTFAKALLKKFTTANSPVIHLDGDILRAIFKNQDYSEEGRRRLAMQYGQLCQLLSQQQIPIIMSTVSLFHEVQCWNRANITGYIEIFLATPLHVLMARDQKHLYSRQDPTLISETIGRGITAEFPEKPDFVFELEKMQELEPATEQLWQHYLHYFPGSRV